MRSPRLRWPTLLLTVWLLAGCSQVELAYRQLDWLIPWYLDDYVTLNDAQQQQLEQRLGTQLVWHRREHLPVYGAALEALQTALTDEDGLSRAELTQFEAELAGLWDELIARLLPDITVLLAGLDDAQVKQLRDSIAANNRDYRSEALNGSPERRRQRRLERAESQLERWLGSISNVQRATIKRWLAAAPNAPADWLAERERWLEAFADALAQRRQPAFDAALKTVLLKPDTLLDGGTLQRREQRRERVRELLLRLDRQLSSAQRQHLLNRLNGLAGDFRRLAD